MARAATAPARPRTAPAPRRRPAPQRRRSGATVPTRAPRQRRRVLDAPAARLLDTLLLGRAWIVLIGVLLTGIVFFNVSLLGLNQGITRDSERAQGLRQQNAELRLQVADLAASGRIQALAEKKGMVMPVAGQVTYIRSRPRADARRALVRMEAPAPAGSFAARSSQSATLPAATPPAASSPAQTQTAAPAQAAVQQAPTAPAP